MSGDSEAVVMAPGEAARVLGVSASGLRRLATAYEQAHGELGKDAGGARVWTGEAVERMRSARALLAAGRARSVRDALEQVEAGAEVSPAAALAVSRDVQVLEVIAARLEGLERLEREVAALRSEVGGLRRLPAAGGPPEVEAGGASTKAAAGRSDDDGLMVRAARWLEGLLRRR